MFEKLGVVTNIWAKRMEDGDSFAALARRFGDHGFKDMEVRDGDYLRNSNFGVLIREIEMAMSRYTDVQWKQTCEAVWAGEGWRGEVQASDRDLFQRARDFVEQVGDLVLSYAVSHPWLSPPENIEADNQKIVRAKKLAYLLRPRGARLRLVDLTTAGACPEPERGEIDPEAAVANVQRYRSLAPDYPMAFAVENARQPATLTLGVAVRGGALLTYDEANTYREDGATLNPPETFWDAVKMENLTSVHFKQKTAAGVLSQVGDGFVDFAAMARRLAAGSYKGDLLLENTPTAHPLEDAIRSRDYLSRLLDC
jgi:sugar phosphate isomerase/epimerase